MDKSELEEGEILKKGSPSQDKKEAENATTPTYNWCKIPCDPKDYGGQDHYYMHFVTQESRPDEPDEPYYLWNLETQSVDEAGLQQPSKVSKQAKETTKSSGSGGEKEEYWGYNPKIHGKYDPTAPYAAYHNKKRDEDEAAEQAALPGAAGIYDSAAKFNRFTGAFQNPDQGADRHSDASKSHRQLSAFFDVDAAANIHDGRSLKAERQQKKFTKKEIQEMTARRKEKKMKKRLDWLKN